MIKFRWAENFENIAKFGILLQNFISCRHNFLKEAGKNIQILGIFLSFSREKFSKIFNWRDFLRDILNNWPTSDTEINYFNGLQ